jgi:hypothetical protein
MRGRVVDWPLLLSIELPGLGKVKDKIIPSCFTIEVTGIYNKPLAQGKGLVFEQV